MQRRGVAGGTRRLWYNYRVFAARGDPISSTPRPRGENLMSPEKKPFSDDFDQKLRGDAILSDEDLALLMGMGGRPSRKRPDFAALEPGTRVRGTVVEVRGQEVLVELDGKTLGAIDLAEYGDAEPPRPGSAVEAELVRHDRQRGLCQLAIGAVRSELAWEELRPGLVLEGNVVATNKGGLTLDIKGIRAFLPISQIDLARVENLEPYVGRKLQCEVTQVDRAERNLVVSRRAILERERQAERERALARIQKGAVIRGRVVRITEHGAFVDLGGVDGLLHASKIAKQLQGKAGAEPLRAGDQLEVEVVNVDRERGRIGLDFRAVEAGAWDSIIESYHEGDEVAGWISRQVEGGVLLAIEEGLEALIPEASFRGGERPGLGSIVHATIERIDRTAKTMVVRPR
jgi:small subunit ribosomal protein S1